MCDIKLIQFLHRKQSYAFVLQKSQDHKALKNNNTKHQGYKQYNKSVQDQLQRIGDDYKRAFQQAQKDAQQY